VLPLMHFHYDRFDTPNDDLYGKWSVNFSGNPQGEIDKVLISLDESEVSFTRKPDDALTDPALLNRYVGKYVTPTGASVEIRNPTGNVLFVLFPGQPQYELIPNKPGKFRLKAFSDTSIEFVAEANHITGFKISDPSGETFNKKI